jgi:hypothetical protein
LLFLVLGSVADWIKNGYFDSILAALVPLWLICFAISAAGIVMIVVARRRARRPQ